MTTTLVALNTDAPSAVIPPPDTLDAYTRLVETLLRDVSKVKAARFTLHLRGGKSTLRPHECTASALNRWELALAKLQKRKLLLIAVVDGPLCDLSLSLALACDVRLGTADASLKRGGAGEHVPLPAWSLASLALHVGVRRAQQLLWRRRDIGAHELLSCGMLHAPLGNTAAELLDAAASLPVPQSCRSTYFAASSSRASPSPAAIRSATRSPSRLSSSPEPLAVRPPRAVRSHCPIYSRCPSN